MARVCVIGGCTWDILFTTPEARLVAVSQRRQRFLAFPYGGKLDAEDIVYGFGGGAANVSVGLRRLGIPVSIVSRVGNDWRGKEVVANLKRHQVDISSIQLDKEQPTPLSFVVTTGGPRDHVAFVARGSTRKLVLPRSLPRDVGWVYLTALAVSDWQSKLRQLFHSLHNQSARIFWNPGRKQLKDGAKLKSLLRYVTVLDLNREEANYLAHDLGFRGSPPEKLAHELISLGPQMVLITDGRHGAWLASREHVYYHHALRAKPVNTTGAGDAFGTGFLAGLVRSGGDIPTALRWGMLNSTSVIMSVGAQHGLLTLKELRAFEHRYVKAVRTS